MIPLLIICGPTATGKTNLALSLAKKFNGELLSADSRQVYKGMDIGTGKDLPREFRMKNSELRIKNKRIDYYSDGKTRIWGLDLVRPDKDFSVGAFIKYAIPIILDITRRGKLPIVVGGTGLYIQALLSPIDTAHILSDENLRNKLATYSVSDLQKLLQTYDADRFMAMNNSDRNNSRRLIRAIEVAQSTQNKANEAGGLMPYYQEIQPLSICLTMSLPKLFARISVRVNKRIKQGIIREIEELRARGYTWDMPALSAIGYREWQPYCSKTQSYEDTIATWIRHEQQYAKRQLTWFKKQQSLQWVDTKKKGWKKEVVTMVDTWYTEISSKDTVL